MRRHPILYSILFIFLAFFVLAAVVMVIVFFSSENRASLLSRGGEVAVIRIEGPIFESTDIIKELHRYKNRKKVKALVLRIDSPGGAVAPSQEIYEEIKKLKPDKKIVVSMGTVAASGAYYIACPADKIFASPGTITGSIGVIMESLNMSELLKWAHLENRVIKSGKYKDVGSPFRDMTPEERAYLQDLLDNMYNQFVKVVATERNLPLDKMSTIANGKIYTGEQAIKQGLVDQLGTLYDAIEEAKKLAGLPEEARVIWPREDRIPIERFLFQNKTKNSLEHFIKKYFHGLDVPVWMYSLSMDALPQ